MSFCIHQPAFLPWGGYWAKVLASDTLVIMTGVDHSKGDMSNRVKLNGSYLTLPITSGAGGPFIDVQYDTKAVPKIVKTIRQALCSRKNPHASRLEPIISNMETANRGDLELFTELLTYRVYQQLALTDKKVLISEYRPVGDTAEDRLLDFINHHKLEGPYYSGAGGRDYMTGKLEAQGTQTLFPAYNLPDETILTTLANEPDPLDYLQSRVTWACN